MSISRQSRVWRVLPGVILALIVTVDAPSSDSAVPENRPDPPTSEQVVLLEELRQWILGDGGFHAIRHADVAAAIRSRRQSFELFRTFSDPETRRSLLADLPYGDLIARAASRHSVDELLLAAVVQAESSFDAAAVSPRGALGLMQVMPETADLYGVGDALEPRVNIEIGARYLSMLLEQFDGDVELALAAYNAGPGNVLRFEGVPPFRETRRYVRKVLTLYVGSHQTAWEASGARGWLL